MSFSKSNAVGRRLESDEEPIAKRRSPLTSKAKSCAECRRLKLKCDQNFPCVNCKRRGTESICPNGALKTIRGRKLILDSTEALHDRISELESALRKVTGSLDPVTHHPPSHTRLDISLPEDGISGSHASDSEHDSAHDKGPCDMAGASEGDNGEVEGLVDFDRVDQAGRLELVNSKEESTSSRLGHLRIDPARPGVTQFYGNASSVFLVSDQEQEDARISDSNHAPFPFRPGWIQSFVFERDSAMRLSKTLVDLARYLPVPQEAFRLCDSYFENVAWGTNMLNREAFHQDIVHHCYTVSPPEAQILALFFLVLAVGAMFDPLQSNGAAHNSYARDYFALGRACLSLDSSNSLISIHVLVNWLTNAGKMVSCSQSTWQLLGMGMRVVQALGLHRDPSHYGFSPAGIQQRRRIFWELYAFDTTISLSMGRPQMLAAHAFDVLYPEIPSNGDYYHDTRYRMTRHFARINEEQSKLKPSTYSTILQLDREIRKFQHGLPDQIKHAQQFSDATLHKRRSIQRLTIHNHLENVGCMFLHRGWFAKALLDRPDEPLHSKYSPSYVGCLEASKSLLNIVRQLATIDPEICRRRWMFLVHSFSACACLASAVIRAPGSLMASSSLTALQQGVKLFEDGNKPDELSKVERLLKNAERIYVNAGKAVPADEEDLAMIGGTREPSQGISPIRIEHTAALPMSAHSRSAARDSSSIGDHESVLSSATAGISQAQTSHTTDPQAVSSIDYSALQNLFDISPSASFGKEGNTDLAVVPGSLSATSTIMDSGSTLSLIEGQMLNGLNWGDQSVAVPGPEFDFEAFLVNLGLDMSPDTTPLS